MRLHYSHSIRQPLLKYPVSPSYGLAVHAREMLEQVGLSSGRSAPGFVHGKVHCYLAVCLLL